MRQHADLGLPADPLLRPPRLLEHNIPACNHSASLHQTPNQRRLAPTRPGRCGGGEAPGRPKRVTPHVPVHRLVSCLARQTHLLGSWCSDIGARICVWEKSSRQVLILASPAHIEMTRAVTIRTCSIESGRSLGSDCRRCGNEDRCSRC